MIDPPYEDGIFDAGIVINTWWLQATGSRRSEAERALALVIPSLLSTAEIFLVEIEAIHGRAIRSDKRSISGSGSTLRICRSGFSMCEWVSKYQTCVMVLTGGTLLTHA